MTSRSGQDKEAISLQPRALLLYHFCRLQYPAIDLPQDAAVRHLERTFEIYKAKAGKAASAESYLDNLYALDWFLASSCLEGLPAAWEVLFAARAGRSDCLLVEALRARAARLYPRNEEGQDSAVNEFWGHLVVPESEGSVPILARYDGQRPLVPWLIRVFQNWNISLLRRHSAVQALPDDDVALPLPAESEPRWRQVFAEAAGDWLGSLDEDELLLLGLRLRHRLSQREVSRLLKVHEGTISRRTDALRDACLEFLGKRLLVAGWTGDDVYEFVRGEMYSLLIDDPRLSVDRLAAILAHRRKKSDT